MEEEFNEETHYHEPIIDVPKTALGILVWIGFIFIGSYALLQFVGYTNRLEEPLKLMALCFAIYAGMKWYGWCGWPEIYHIGGTYYRRRRRL